MHPFFSAAALNYLIRRLNPAPYAAIEDSPDEWRDRGAIALVDYARQSDGHK
jgi:hypothetical protein